MTKKKVLCGYGIDWDAVSGWINTGGTRPDVDMTDVSRGIFGGGAGIDRILKLLRKYNITATFFVPAHTAESFPEAMKRLCEAGHEIGLHGYTHEFVSELTEDQERAVLAKSIEVITRLSGKPPRGWTAPAWLTSKSTVKILEENNIVYDHSFMHHDCQPYWLPHNPKVTQTDVKKKAEEWMAPMSKLEPSRVVEIPANWHLDDWPPLNVGQVGQGFVDPDVVLKLWKRQFDYYYRENDSFIFPISIHPQVSGKAHVQLMQEELIEYINTHEGVEWVTMEEMARQFKAGEIKGETIVGGV